MCRLEFDGFSWECPSCHTIPPLIEGYMAFAPELNDASDGFEAGYFARLAQLEAENFWFRPRNRLIIWALRRYFSEAKNFFEIGCGTGFVLSGVEGAFPQLSVYGSDIFREGLAYAAERLKSAELFQMDARKIPFKDEFDVIGAFDVLEHIKEDGIVLSQMCQAVRQGGGIILTVPQHPFLWNQYDEYSRHVRRYTSRELRRKVEQAGFKVQRMSSFVSFLLPLMAISRLKKKRKTDSKYDALAELKTNGPVNMMLERVLDMERAIIRLGFSFPAGGSLLLIAYKA